MYCCNNDYMCMKYVLYLWLPLSQCIISRLTVFPSQFSIWMLVYLIFRIFTMRSAQMSIPFCARPERILGIDHYMADFSNFSEMAYYIWFINRHLHNSYICLYEVLSLDRYKMSVRVLVRYENGRLFFLTNAQHLLSCSPDHSLAPSCLCHYPYLPSLKLETSKYIRVTINYMENCGKIKSDLMTALREHGAYLEDRSESL